MKLTATELCRIRHYTFATSAILELIEVDF